MFTFITSPLINGKRIHISRHISNAVRVIRNPCRANAKRLLLGRGGSFNLKSQRTQNRTRAQRPQAAEPVVPQPRRVHTHAPRTLQGERHLRREKKYSFSELLDQARRLPRIYKISDTEKIFLREMEALNRRRADMDAFQRERDRVQAVFALTPEERENNWRQIHMEMAASKQSRLEKERQDAERQRRELDALREEQERRYAERIRRAEEQRRREEFQRERQKQDAEARARMRAREAAEREAAKKERAVAEEARRLAQLRAAQKPAHAHILKLYDDKWNELKARPDLRGIHFFELPWPIVQEGVPSADEITRARIEEFVFHPGRAGFAGKTRRERVRMELLKWHPDKFEAVILPKMEAAERERTREAGGLVARMLMDVLKDEVQKERGGL
ncbi:hypothetical protein PLICRDRAFT_172374 [Plicaturopsis crispa FD-325 SS-3]|nr:hypothetical protein PLICRDRAFT_172374 [Plicaturopsis crispa FD-325 SS-3]